MASVVISPPPTWAEVIIEDPVTKNVQFNPVWLDWFIRIAAALNGSGGSTPAHNSLSGLQGGSSTERFHISSAEHTFVLGSYTTAPAAITVTASPFSYTNSSAFNESVIVQGGTVSKVEFKRGAVTVDTGVIAGMLWLSPGDILITTYTVAPTMTAILR